MTDPFIQRAKEMIRANLATHPDEGVRIISEVAALADDSPQVQRIAKALRGNTLDGGKA